MARGTMHAKKENGRNRNGTPHATRTYPRESVLRGPSLEEATLKADWSPFVVKWWDTWRRTPQAIDFLDTDWLRLALLAPVIESLAAGNTSAAALAEVRMNEERLGATFVDRMRARILVDRAPEETDGPGASVTPIGRRRADV